MDEEFKRITPEEALKQCNSENKGKLKILIGYAPGVGKTYSMLNEGNRRAKGGKDIVIGYVETHQRIVEKADEVVVVDITSDALQNRLKRGNVYNLKSEWVVVSVDCTYKFAHGTTPKQQLK